MMCIFPMSYRRIYSLEDILLVLESDVARHLALPRKIRGRERLKIPLYILLGLTLGVLELTSIFINTLVESFWDVARYAEKLDIASVFKAVARLFISTAMVLIAALAFPFRWLVVVSRRTFR